MASQQIIVICQYGGEFKNNKDGSLSYSGGDAHAIDIDEEMTFDDFKKEVSEMFSCSISKMNVKYFIPGNKKTLITISNDKDLKRMITFHRDSLTADVYIIMEAVDAPAASNMPAKRSRKKTTTQPVPSLDPPLDLVENIVTDTTQQNLSLDVNNGTNNVAAFTDGAQTVLPAVIPSIVSPVLSIEEKRVKAAQQWQNAITGVGQRFNGVHEFREALRKYALANQFTFRYKKNDNHRVTVRCKTDGCPWRIHASNLTTTQLICIKKMNPTHTCNGAVNNENVATRSWVAGILKEKLKNCPNYKPKNIADDIKQEFGVEVTVPGREIAKQLRRGLYKQAYKQLPFYCERIKETNPGSLAIFTTKEDSSFDRLFIAFNASLNGFLQGCRPLLFLDSIPLKSKYQASLLAANAADGDDGVFPVAFSVVDAETADNWYWFLQQLKSALTTSCPLTIIADRQKGLKESISEIFNDSHHGYCVRYLTDQLIRDLKGQLSQEVKRLLIENLYAAAYAPTPEGFRSSIESIRSISLEAYNWISQSEPQNWANAYFQGQRYNHLTSNFGELFYSWTSDANELPITQTVDVIREKTMEIIYTRRAESSQWVTRLTPSMEAKLEKETLKVCSLQAMLASGSTFEVRGDTVEAVDMDRWDCSCKGWQLTGLPCCHALAIITCSGRSPYDFCGRYFTTESYRLTYSQSINPVPDVPRKKDLGVIVTPPPTRRPPGRPPSKKSGSSEVNKRQLQCSKCKGSGHNKSKCKELL